MSEFHYIVPNSELFQHARTMRAKYLRQLAADAIGRVANFLRRPARLAH